MGCGAPVGVAVRASGDDRRGSRDDHDHSPRRAASWLTVALLGGMLFAGLAASVEDLRENEEVEGLVAADQSVQDWLAVHAPTWTVYMGVFLAGAGGAIPMVALMGLVALILWSRDQRLEAVTLVTTALVLEAAILALKWFFARPRPEGGILFAQGFSFPSGHAAFGAFLACLIVWLTLRHVRGRLPVGILASFAVGWAVSMAAGRMIVHVHYLTDVLAGIGLGLFFGGVAFALPDLARWRAHHVRQQRHTTR